MICPKCGKGTAVVDTRQNKLGVRRRRECKARKCKIRFSTIEVVADGPLNPFEAARDEMLKRVEEALALAKGQMTPAGRK